MKLEEIHRQLVSHFAQSREWLLIAQSGETFALRTDEIEIEISREKVLLSYQSRNGFETWRVTNYRIERKKIFLELNRNFGAEKTKIEFVPRASAIENSEMVELVRLEKANKIARQLVENGDKIKLTRVSLKQESGRLARIFLEDKNGTGVLALFDVSETLTAERLLTTAILDFEKLSQRRKKPIEKIWILAPKKTARSLQKLLAMLESKWQPRIAVSQISAVSDDESKQKFQTLVLLSMADLWLEKPSKISNGENIALSETTQKIVALAPDEIDIVFSKHGETLRFRGLPFARVRSFARKEKAWFGVENNRQILNESTANEFLKFVADLKTYRRFDAPSKRHAFYHLLPEAWLESALRKNIKLLDGNLILSPLHTQFRAGRDKIDLLALRRDGRLVIIELKTAPDREMIFQTLNYWRKIEIERRNGNLQKAKIFGAAEIRDEPALVYLVAPLLEFHRDLDFLSRTIQPEIEIYRFDLNQNWRENLRVARQIKMSAKTF